METRHAGTAGSFVQRPAASVGARPRGDAGTTVNSIATVDKKASADNRESFNWSLTNRKKLQPGHCSTKKVASVDRTSFDHR